MRYKVRVLLLVFLGHALIILFIWSLLKNPDLLDQPRILAFSGRNLQSNKNDQFKEVPCNINGEYNISCRKENGEVYLPFNFVKKYFDVYGKLVERNGVEIFNWSHSYANVYIPKKKYDPRGVFTHFQSYKVEERERVKCISASEGVPLSTQWNPKGYFYPTQIAQFGLSHYSKSLIEPESVKLVLEDGETTRAYWSASHTAEVRRIQDPDVDSMVLCSDAGSKLISLRTNLTLPILSFDLKLKPINTSKLTVVIQNLAEKQTYNLHYTCDQQHISVSDFDIHYGLFCKDTFQWHKLSRDLVIDIQKGIMLKTKSKPKLPRSSFRVESIALQGEGCVDNLTALSSDHMTYFKFAVDWFLHHQDEETGGWPNPVTRKMAGSLILKPGWYSAMGQGHGLSVLARAYHLEKDIKYLEAAQKALSPFRVLSKNHGVLAMYMQEVPWYEEYPTDPSTFVLNGFIYSLVGLYDFHRLASPEYSREAYSLYVQGMTSLKKMLMAFDTGSGTTYDLRHITLGTVPKIARWDYHATHVNQLFMLSTIDKDPLFSVTAKRWLGYMSGKRASHN